MEDNANFELPAPKQIPWNKRPQMRVSTKLKSRQSPSAQPHMFVPPLKPLRAGGNDKSRI
jgi:hypothetical protein